VATWRAALSCFKKTFVNDNPTTVKITAVARCVRVVEKTNDSTVAAAPHGRKMACAAGIAYHRLMFFRHG
jgi:hypothetical protein